jgi:hypothetical protein
LLEVRSWRVVVAGALLVLLSGCQIRVVAGVDARRDGSGIVRAGVGLDREALQQVPDLPGRLRVDDLKRAGWDVAGPAAEKDGLTWVRATKKFSTPAEANKAVTELNGSTGPFQQFRLTRSHSLLRTSTRFRGVVDLTSGANGFTDEQVRQRLGGTDLGLDEQTLQRRVGIVLNRIFRVQVVAKLPGKTDDNAPTHTADGVLWRPKLGERASLIANATSWNTPVLFFGSFALLAVVAFAVLLVRGRRGGRDVAVVPRP